MSELNCVHIIIVAGDFWTEDALDDFERMTYCAQWKPLLAKLCSYSHTEMSSWPSVKLYDNSQGKVRAHKTSFLFFFLDSTLLKSQV